MESLIRKLNRWHTLKGEHSVLVLEKRKLEIQKKIEEAKKTKDIPKLLEILTADGDKCEDLDEFLIQEFKKSIKFNLKERISCIIQCMSILKLEYEGPRKMLIDHLESFYSKINGASISVRLDTLMGFQEYDKTNGLRIFEYIKDKMEEEIDIYTKNSSITTPKELDRWLNEAIKIYRYKPEIVEKYRALEIKYFLMCFDMVESNDRESMVEDAAYLINKIQKRSNAMGVDIAGEVKEKLKECGLLDEDELRRFFENLFPFLR